MKIEILTVSSDKKGMRKEYTSFLRTLNLFFETAFREDKRRHMLLPDSE